MKPEIICHIMSSVDGRLHPERYSKPFYEKEDPFYLTSYFRIGSQLQAQAILIGRTTFQEHFSKNTFEHKDYDPIGKYEIFKGKCNAGHFSIILDAKGKIAHETGEAWGTNLIVVLGEQVSEEYLVHLQGLGISYLFAGKDGRDMEKALDTLQQEFGIKRILLEGGATVNGIFLKAGLIDELSLTIYPGIDGLAGMPTIFEYQGKANEYPADRQRLELFSMKMEDGGIAWLRYKFHKD